MENTTDAVAERLAIVGSGTIACGLAATAAQSGTVTLWARSAESAARAEKVIATTCGKIEADPANVVVATGLDGAEDATFVVEAVAEDRRVKHEFLADLGRRLDPATVLATTTSSLSVGELAQSSGRPERFVGFHVFNPVPRMQLVELAFPGSADPDTKDRAHALCTRLGKRAVEVPDTPGFVVNRLLFPYLLDAVRVAERFGMAPEEVDACMTLGAGQPMGPFALLDFVGLDISIAIAEQLGSDVPDALRDKVAEGARGKKAGRGFYTY